MDFSIQGNSKIPFYINIIFIILFTISEQHLIDLQYSIDQRQKFWFLLKILKWYCLFQFHIYINVGGRGSTFNNDKDANL